MDKLKEFLTTYIVQNDDEQDLDNADYGVPHYIQLLRYIAETE